MKKSTFQQTAKVGVSGSFINQMMSNNNSLPEVGKGATRLGYSDRYCYEVIEVSADSKTVKLEELDAQIDPIYLESIKGADCRGHQNWILKPTGRFLTVVWRNGAWKVKVQVINFTKEFQTKHRQLTEEEIIAIFGENIRPQNVVEGITELKTEYHKINILFGTKDYYYDWSF